MGQEYKYNGRPVKCGYVSQHKSAGARMKCNCTSILLLAFAICSCDKPPPSVSTPPSTEESSSELDYRPTSLTLDRTLRLIDYPLQIRVPDRWDIRYGAVTILQGPIPHGPKPDGVIHLMLSRRGPLPKAIMDALKPSTKPTTKDPYFRDERRAMGRLQVHEQRSTQPATDKDPALIKWTFIAYEPMDKDNIRMYQLSFLRLTVDQFEKDRELLESIIASISSTDE
jgi:hypothetical protein